ncbi:MAG: zinc ABC transporter substrate-binding protein [Pseudomonadota bacterium]|nr:zinc ABC transporter substrate-binding protein [Pseudomonadota bacterium]
MKFLRSLTLVCLPIGAAPLWAEVPQVVTDIGPVQSIAAMVMGDLGTPQAIVPPEVSPHDFALRPSQARALDGADLLVWAGPELTPWMEKATSALSGEARQIRLLGVEGTTVLAYRDPIEAHEDHDDHDHEGHDHDHDHEGHDHDHDHEGHDHEGHDDHHDHEGHDHEGTDPHAWLDPQNAATWAEAIAADLATLDPENAETYRANAAKARAELEALTGEITQQLARHDTLGFVTFHDAFQYFENRFGLQSSGTVSLGDASQPSPARLSRLREAMAERGVTCAFREPQYNDRLLQVASEGGAVTIAVLDPLGVNQQPGAGMYPAILRAMAQAVADCAGH